MANNIAMGSGMASGMSIGAGQAIPPPNEFQDFCKRELEYHKGMAIMFEMLLAQDLLLENEPAQEALRTLIVAGMHHLANQTRPG
jgi:hypothetical protein